MKSNGTAQSAGHHGENSQPVPLRVERGVGLIDCLPEPSTAWGFGKSANVAATAGIRKQDAGGWKRPSASVKDQSHAFGDVRCQGVIRHV